jgi:hypothetical protein
MTIVEPDNEPLTVTRAWIANLKSSGLTPVAEIDGRLCFIETKPTLLEGGVASCIPMEGSDDDWPHAVRIRASGESEIRTIWNSTTHAEVVRAARRWAALAETGDASAGLALI